VRRFAGVAIWLLAAACPLRAQDAASREILSALNAERNRMELEPLSLSIPLARLAQARADEISAGERLDFDPPGASALLRAAWDLGYQGTLTQEVTSVVDGETCEVVEAWNENLGGSDVYRRPEIREAGVGFGVVGESALIVLIVGAPSPPPGARQRWPGNVPREWLTGDLLDEIDRKRVGMALPSLEREDAMGETAQDLANEILVDGTAFGRGRRNVTEGTLLYFKGGRTYTKGWGDALKEWLAVDHSVLARAGKVPAGAGLASRGTGGRVQAVWTVLVGDVASGPE